MKHKSMIVSVFHAIYQCAPVSALVCALCSLIYALCATYSTKFMALMLEEAETIREDTLPQITFFALCYLAIQIARKVFNLIQDVCWNVGVEEKCKYHFQMRLSEKSALLPYIAFEDEQKHDSIVRARSSVDSMAVTQAYTNLLAVLECIITVIGLLITMATYSVWYLPIMFLSVIPFLISRLKVGKEFYTLRWFQARHIRKRNYFYSLFTSPVFQKEQRIFGFGESMKRRWEEQRKLVSEETVSFRTKDSNRLAWCETLITFGYIASILLSFFLVINGDIALGVFGAGIYAFRTAQGSTRSLFALYGILNENLMEAGNYFEFLDLEEEPERNGAISNLSKGISVNNVKFSYPNTCTSALEIDHLTIKAGERVVVVGENGSGKSTLVKLLTGLYTPDTGDILYDGINIDSISRDSLSQLIGAVSQDFVSYHLSIRDNVGIRSPEASENDERIHEALVQAGLVLPPNYDQWLGREFDGPEFSGGQWQRLAIASVLCKPHQIIFLDEPTSALDPNAEYDILKYFMELSDGKTAVIISHRVGLCRLADKVVFLKDGRVKGVGSHQQLLQSCEEYSHFYAEQAKWHTA